MPGSTSNKTMTTKTTHTTAQHTGPRLKDADRPAAPPHGETHADKGMEGETPRMPHERDESADSQHSQTREVMKQAHQDVSRGMPDTDKGPPMDDAYQKQVKGSGQDR